MAAGTGYDQSYANRTGKAPDWHCPECKNKNFGWREVCNRCSVRCYLCEQCLTGLSVFGHQSCISVLRLVQLVGGAIQSLFAAMPPVSNHLGVLLFTFSVLPSLSSCSTSTRCVLEVCMGLDDQ